MSGLDPEFNRKIVENILGGASVCRKCTGPSRAHGVPSSGSTHCSPNRAIHRAAVEVVGDEDFDSLE